MKHLALIGAMLLIAASPLAAGEGVLTLEELVVLDAGSALMARDVLDTEGVDHPKCLEGVRLGKAPQPGRSLLMSRAQVRKGVEKAGCSIEGLEIAGATRVRIEGRSLQVESAEIQRAFEPLRAHFADQGLDARVELLGEAPRLALAPGKHRVLFAGSPERFRAGRVSLPLTVESGGRTRRTTIPARLLLRGRVASATRPLSVSHTLSPGDLKLVEADLPERCVPVTSLEKVDGAVLKRALPEGEVLCRRHASIPPDVKAGDSVLVSLEMGEVSLLLETVARSRGYEGDSIRVVGLDGRTLVSAVVAGPGRAVVRTIPRSTPRSTSRSNGSRP